MKLRLALLLAAALLFAQLGAQAHAYSHIRTGSHVAGQLDFHTSQCFDCLSFAPLLAGAGTPGPLPGLAVHGVPAAPDADVTTSVIVAPAHAFRSRAPPSGR
jgi:hypothetical protein